MKKILLTFLSLSTIYFAQAQCEIFATVLSDSANCNETVEIQLEGFSQVFINELFTPTGPTDPNWITTSGAQYDNPYIPSNSGGTYFWMGPSASVPTSLTTTPFDLSVASNGQICFEFVYADGVQGAYNPPQSATTPTPEQPDLYNEGIVVQYNTGAGWVDIVYYAPNGDILAGTPAASAPSTDGTFEVWTNVCIDIPIGAFTANTQFQFLQENNSGACCDHWGIDDIQIVTADPSYNIFFLNNSSLLGPSPDSLDVEVTSDSSFYFLFSNGIDFCRDTVDMFVNPTTAMSQYTGSCDSIGYQLSVGGVEPSSVVSWSPSLGLDNPNIQTPHANPVNDQMYIVTSDCGVDSTFVNVVPAFTASVAASADSICVGDVTILTATTDQPTYNYTYQWTPATVSDDTIPITTGFPSINTTYVVTMITDSGCVRQDSVTVYVGAVPKTIEYVGDMNICRGDSTQITVIPTQPTFFDDFNTGANPSIWQDIQNGTANNDCGSISGTALHFDGIGDRWAQLYPVDASLGGTISFNLIYGSDFAAGAACADVSFNDIMQLEFSTNGGTTWTTINTYANNSYNNWTLIQESVPAAAMMINTIFRFHQPLHTGQDRDNWALEDFLLELNCTGTGCIQYSYLWSPATNVSDVTSASPFFYPNTSTYYSVAISPQGFNCNVAADSILIAVDELDISITPSDSFLCEPNSPILLEAEISGFSSGCENEYIVSQTPINMLSGTATNLSLGDDQVSPTILMPFDFEFYCETKNSFGVSSNGFLTFSGSTASGCCSGQNLPNTNIQNDVIALMWSDLNPNNGGSISHFVSGTAPNRVQVVEFTNVPHFGASGATVSGQIQMFEYSNIVEIHCLDCQTDNGIITMGLENSAGTIGHTPAGYNAANWSATGEAWRFIPTNSPANFQFGWTPNVAINNDSILNPLVSPTSSTDYVFSVYNINNCLFTDTAEISVYESNITLTGDISACFGDSIQLEATGADTYAWSPNIALNDSSISDPLSGTNVDMTYYVTYNTQGCEEVDSVSIDILNLPSGIINNNINPVKFCEGTTQELFVDNLNGWTFAWEDQNGNSLGGTSSIFITDPGTYSVSYNDGTCVNTTNVVVNESPNPVIDFTTVEKVLCCNDYNEEVIFADVVSNVALSNIYINGTEETATSYTYTSEGDNFVQLDHYRFISDDGCEAEADLSIATKCLKPEFTNPDTIYLNTPVTFDLTTYDSGADNVSYTWSTTETGTAIADPSIEDAVFNGAVEGGPYTSDVEVIALYGSRTCTENATSSNYDVVELKDPLYPDAFTPNGDGTNDYYKPIINVLATTTELRIYNRWGDIVYDMAKDDAKLGWNGQWNSQDQPSDLYMFYAKTIHPDGREFIQEGSVSLIR